MGCYVSGGSGGFTRGRRRRVSSQWLQRGLGSRPGAAPVHHLDPRRRHRRGLRAHHHRGSGGERDFDEDVSAGEVDAHGAQLVPVQPGSGGPAAAGHVRPGGRQPVPAGRVDVRPARLQADPFHPAQLGGGVRVHPDCALRGPVPQLCHTQTELRPALTLSFFTSI